MFVKGRKLLRYHAALLGTRLAYTHPHTRVFRATWFVKKVCLTRSCCSPERFYGVPKCTKDAGAHGRPGVQNCVRVRLGVGLGISLYGRGGVKLRPVPQRPPFVPL